VEGKGGAWRGNHLGHSMGQGRGVGVNSGGTEGNVGRVGRRDANGWLTRGGDGGDSW